jgi:integrase
MEPAISGEILAVRAGLRLAVAALSRPLQGAVPHAHGLRPARLPRLVPRARAGPLDRDPPTRRAVPALDARNAPLQALDRIPPALGNRRFLPYLRDRQHPGALASRYVLRPNVPRSHRRSGSPTCRFEALLTAARELTGDNDFALVAMLGLLGLRILEATSSSIEDLGEEHGHRVLRVHGKGDKVVLVPLTPALGRAIERAVGDRADGPILCT